MTTLVYQPIYATLSSRELWTDNTVKSALKLITQEKVEKKFMMLSEMKVGEMPC